MCLKIKLDKISDIQQFVAKASKYNDLTISAQTFIVNARSLMGILSLDLDKPVYLCWQDNRDSERIKNDFEQWTV